MKYTVHYVPHTHYDAEVFLTRDETLEIGCSILTGALATMQENPSFTFAIDQTCYIAPYLTKYPEHRSLFERLVTEKRIEVTCGMHAMPDVNIPSGESFIRQVLSGKGWCRRELGVDVRCGWLLDTFGQHPQIPQLMVQCGFDHNVFQRLGTTDGPTEFWWKGLDGTKLFCHWMRSSYAVLHGMPRSQDLFPKFADTRLRTLKKHAVTSHLLAVSGADLTHIEPHAAEVFRGYNESHDDLEFVFSTPQRYFDIVKQANAKFPTTQGDKNPVFQGCYSARIAIKQWNRRMEALLANCEIADSICRVLDKRSRAKQLTDCWEPILFNQFHDIICGSHVDKVYANVIDRYKESHSQAESCLESSIDQIVSEIDTEGADGGISVVVFNSLSWDRDDAAECKVAFVEQDVIELEVRDSEGNVVPHDILGCERYGTGGIKRATVLFIAQGVPSMGYDVYTVRKATGEPAASNLSSNQPDFLMADNHRDQIENEFFSLEIDAWNGAILSLYDKTTDYEFIPVDRAYGGTIVKELDNGNFWEYNGHCKGDALTPINREHPLPAEGDCRAAFSHHYGGDGRVTNGRARTDYNVNFAFGEGHFSTRIRLYTGLPRIDIRTTLVNRDERVRYRMALPTTLHGGKVTFEIPFGAIERPEGEFAAQNWMDYTDNSRGLALLNRGLPGNCVHDNVLLLSLLKCTSIREGYGEVGGFSHSAKTSGGYEIGVQHAFDYALAPHIGDWRDANLVQKGLEFNRPLLVQKATRKKGILPKRLSFATVSAHNVVISAIKPADEGEGIVIRLYECCGWETKAVELRSSFEIEEVQSVNLIEQEPEPIDRGKSKDKKAITFDIGAFEIRTFLISAAHDISP